MLKTRSTSILLSQFIRFDSTNPKYNFFGFTLIELLIVVAIIAILAAIAIPNFLAAQVRAKISRVHSEMRTIVTGLEAYYTDNNEYPYNELFYGAVWRLTTPISYLSNYPNDPFGPNAAFIGARQIFTTPKHHYYFYCRWANLNGVDDNIWDSDRDDLDRFWLNKWFGYWGINSFGPDNVYEPEAENYDPTNGTISKGDIWRRQNGKDRSD
jgi:prepilin-type N-terminal cleavage/methylation domain-containing protein